jgi:hypothetical protein
VLNQTITLNQQNNEKSGMRFNVFKKAIYVDGRT